MGIILRWVVCVVALGADLFPAESPTAANVFAALVQRRTTQILWSGEIARIAAGESQAVFTALKVKDPAEPGAIAMGFRLELARPGARRVIHLGGIETRMFTVGALALDRVEPPAAGPGAARHAGSPDFMDGGHGVLLGAHYAQGSETGTVLAIRGEEGWYYFPGKTPQEFAAAFRAGWLALRQHPFAHDEGWNPGPSRGQPPEGPTAVQAQNLHFYLIAVPPTVAPSAPAQPMSESGRGRDGTPQATAFEGVVKAAGARIVSSDEIARIEASGELAIFTALRVHPTFPGAGVVPGIKVELSAKDSWRRAEVFLGAEEIAAELKGIRAIIEGLPRHLELRAQGRIGPGPGYGYFGAAEFRRPSRQLLNVAVYSHRADEAGVGLGAFRGDGGYFHFPGRTVEEVREAIEKGARALGLL